MKRLTFALLLVCSTAFAEDKVKIQVITEESTPYGTFRDAIYYPDMASYNDAVQDGSHQAEKANRVANYVNAIQNPPTPVEPSKEELQEYKAQLVAQVAELDAKILTAKTKGTKLEAIIE